MEVSSKEKTHVASGLRGAEGNSEGEGDGNDGSHNVTNGNSDSNCDRGDIVNIEGAKTNKENKVRRARIISTDRFP